MKSVEGFSILAVALEYLPPQFDQKWDKTARNFYFQMLSDIPDSDIPVLAKLIGTQFKKRPTPAEILDKWREVVSPPKRTIADVVAAIYEAIDTPQFKDSWYPSRVFVPDPGQEDKARQFASKFTAALAGDAKTPPGIVGADADSKPTGHWEDVRVPCKMHSYDLPESIKNDPVLMRTVEGAGGWETVKWFGRGSVQSKHLWFVAKSVVEGEGDAAINRLRLEYQAEQSAQRMLESHDEEADEYMQAIEENVD